METSDERILAILADEDPEGLLALGAPAGEYQPEAAAIAARLAALSPSHATVVAVVSTVREVWEQMFGNLSEAEARAREPVFNKIGERILSEAVRRH